MAKYQEELLKPGDYVFKKEYVNENYREVQIKDIANILKVIDYSDGWKDIVEDSIRKDQNYNIHVEYKLESLIKNDWGSSLTIRTTHFYLIKLTIEDILILKNLFDDFVKDALKSM